MADSFHTPVETILVLLLIVFAVALIARRARLPYTIALAVTRLLGFQPNRRDLQLTPEYRTKKEQLMLSMLARNWWVLALRGVLAIIFGVLAIVWPGLTLLVLIALFGAYALVDGIFAVIAGIASYGQNERWWAVLLEGIGGILLIILAFRLRSLPRDDQPADASRAARV
jgi:hypothetical protein